MWHSVTPVSAPVMITDQWSVHPVSLQWSALVTSPPTHHNLISCHWAQTGRRWSRACVICWCSQDHDHNSTTSRSGSFSEWVAWTNQILWHLILFPANYAFYWGIDPLKYQNVFKFELKFFQNVDMPMFMNMLEQWMLLLKWMKNERNFRQLDCSVTVEFLQLGMQLNGVSWNWLEIPPNSGLYFVSASSQCFVSYWFSITCRQSLKPY